MPPEEKVNQNITPPQKPETKETPVLGPNTSELKSLRTYQGDISNAISLSKVSVVSIAAAEQNRKSVDKTLPESQESERIKNKSFILIGSLLLLLGIASVSAVFYINLQKIESKNPEETSILSHSVFADFAVASSTREELLETILLKKREFGKPVNSILWIKTTKLNLKADIKDVLNLLTPSMPNPLVRNITNNYMIGIYSLDTNEPFIILNAEDYGSSYAGMLEWEPNIISDIGRLFNIPIVPAGVTSPYIFTDESTHNKDIRLVKASGKTILLYSFIDKNTILITSNERVFEAILGKYYTSQMVR